MLWTLKKCYYRINQKVLKFAMCFMDWREPTLLEGDGAVLRLPSFVKEKGLSKVLVVTDKGLMNLHLLDPFFEEMKKQGNFETVFFENRVFDSTCSSIWRAVLIAAGIPSPWESPSSSCPSMTNR